MPSQDKLFLTASVDTSNALTTLFDFVWPTATALWNLQWQAKGFLARVPEATVDDLRSRFVLGSGIRGANIHRLVKENSWDDAQQWFARLLLSETCSLFEGWIEAAMEELQIPRSIRGQNGPTLDKKLQFPTVRNAAGQVSGGVQYAIEKIRHAGASPIVQQFFLPTLNAHKKNSNSTLEQLLICYRAFKELRNDFVHHGGLASAKAMDAFIDFNAETAASLGLKEKPTLPTVVIGHRIELSLRGVVGLSDVVLRIVTTLDSQLADSTYGEKLIKIKWLASHRGRVTVKAAGPARDAQLTKLILQSKLPPPAAVADLYEYLSANRLAV